MIDMIDCRSEHLDAIEPLQSLKSEAPFLGNLKLSLSYYGMIAKTVRVDGHPIACFGSFPTHEGTFIWGWLGEQIKKQKFAFIRKVHEGFDLMIKATQPRQLVMCVKKDCPEIIKWANFLKFEVGPEEITGLDGIRYYKMIRMVR